MNKSVKSAFFNRNFNCWQVVRALNKNIFFTHISDISIFLPECWQPTIQLNINKPYWTLSEKGKDGCICCLFIFYYCLRSRGMECQNSWYFISLINSWLVIMSYLCYILLLLQFLGVNPNQCCHLICSNLSANHLCIVGTNFKFSCLFSCDIRKIYCDLLSKLTKLE